MRVIGGKVRGRPLHAPHSTATRPTSDLARAAIFNMLVAAGADFDQVLDLYAGSGALGIEALSRGDGRCDFVEQDRAACDIIRRNLRELGLEERGRVLSLSVGRAIETLKGPYTLVLADPPYGDTQAPDLVVRAVGEGKLAAHGILMYEHGKRTASPESAGEFTLFRERRYGDTLIALYGHADYAPEQEVGSERE